MLRRALCLTPDAVLRSLRWAAAADAAFWAGARSAATDDEWARLTRSSYVVLTYHRLAGDRIPHRDIGSRRFEIGSGLLCLFLLAGKRGPLDPATLGGLASSAPDLEHVLPFLRPRGGKLFHGRYGWHRSGRFATQVQLLLAGAIIGGLIAMPKKGDSR